MNEFLGTMLKRDQAARGFGIQIVRADRGEAVATMTVREDMLNGFDITHGGLIFALADTAFAVACNEDDRVTVAAGADIIFVRPTVVGEKLTAHAVRRTLRGRNGVYDVTITDGTGDIVAEFRGRSLVTNRVLQP